MRLFFLFCFTLTYKRTEKMSTILAHTVIYAAWICFSHTVYSDIIYEEPVILDTHIRPAAVYIVKWPFSLKLIGTWKTSLFFTYKSIRESCHLHNCRKFLLQHLIQQKKNSQLDFIALFVKFLCCCEYLNNFFKSVFHLGNVINMHTP